MSGLSKSLSFKLILAVFIALVLWWSIYSNRHEPLISVSSIGEPLREPVANDAVLATDDIDSSNRELVNQAAVPRNPQPSALVEGWIRNRQEQPVSGAEIELRSKSLPPLEQNIYRITSDQSGKFQLNAIPTGDDYQFEVLAHAGYSGKVLYPIAVENGMDPLSIVVDSLELASTQGMFVGADDSPIANFEIMVQNVDLSYPGRKITSDSSGFFQLTRFPAGELQLSTTTEGNEHFKITGITLRSNEYRDMTLSIDKGGYYLSGWISDEFDRPLAQARVVLTSSISSENYRSSSYRFTQTDNNGNFGFSGLGGQSHKLVVEAIGYESVIIDHHFQSFSDTLAVRLQPN